MAITRLVADPVMARFGAPVLAQTCAPLATLGMQTIILARLPAVVVVGLVALGFGLSILVPLAFGAAGQRAAATRRRVGG
jgi:hypothetical protein